MILLKVTEKKRLKKKCYWSHVDRLHGWSGINVVLIHCPTFASCSLEIAITLSKACVHVCCVKMGVLGGVGVVFGVQQQAATDG